MLFFFAFHVLYLTMWYEFVLKQKKEQSKHLKINVTVSLCPSYIHDIKWSFAVIGIGVSTVGLYVHGKLCTPHVSALPTMENHSVHCCVSKLLWLQGSSTIRGMAWSQKINSNSKDECICNDVLLLEYELHTCENMPFLSICIFAVFIRFLFSTNLTQLLPWAS